MFFTTLVFRESELLKSHRRVVSGHDYEGRMNRLASEVESSLKTETMDFVGEETLRRVRERKVTKMQPTPERLVQRHCGRYERIPRSHTFANWTVK